MRKREMIALIKRAAKLANKCGTIVPSKLEDDELASRVFGLHEKGRIILELLNKKK